MRILVTGATGVVGRRLVPMLRTVGHDISGVARSPAARTQLERYGAKAIDRRSLPMTTMLSASRKNRRTSKAGKKTTWRMERAPLISGVKTRLSYSIQMMPHNAWRELLMMSALFVRALYMLATRAFGIGA